MEKTIIVEQRHLKSKTGKTREGMFKFMRERISFSKGKEEDPKALMEMLNELVRCQKSKKDMIMDHINNLEDLAKRVIRKSGLDPDDMETIFTFEDGSKSNYCGAIARRKEEREPEGYAGDILFHARQLRHNIENNNLFEALYSGLKMEEAYGSFNLAQHELEILIGTERMAQGSNLKFTGEDKAGWIAQAQQLWETSPSEYLKANGEKNYRQTAVRIIVDNKMENKAVQTVEKHLANSGKKM
ncbi:MAG: hypothetical protein DRQ40_09835 [Gammaproteobacteria bacterium]|nr:MAG: hypothetical protein DRQ40_09835 [Gammaproteobacteria bacterium]